VNPADDIQGDWSRHYAIKSLPYKMKGQNFSRVVKMEEISAVKYFQGVANCVQPDF